MSVFFFRLLLLSSLSLTGTSLLAQSPLSLDEALARGLENNFGIRVADEQIDVAGLQNTWGLAGRWPTLDFNGSGSFFRTGNPAAFSPGRQNISGSLNLNWVLFDGFRVQATKTQLDLLEAQSGGNAAIVVENTLQAIILGYYNVLVAEAQAEVLDEVLRTSKDRLAYQRFRQDLGAAGSFEVLQFRTAVITDSVNLINQQLNVRNAYRTLNLLMGEDEDAPFYLTDSLPVAFPAYDWDILSDRLVSDNRSLRNQYLNIELRRQDSRLARAAYYPTFAISTGGTYTLGSALLRNNDPATQAETPVITRSFGAFDYTAGFSLTFNLFDGGNRSQRVQIAEANEHIAQLQREELELSLRQELRTQWDNYAVRRDLLALQTENVGYTRTQLEVAGERFRSGLISSLDYRDIQVQHLTTELSRLQALWSLKEAETELIRLTGGLVRQETE